MKTKKEKKEANKFDLEKFKVAKLKNLHLIKGGGDETLTGKALQLPSKLCEP